MAQVLLWQSVCVPFAIPTYRLETTEGMSNVRFRAAAASSDDATEEQPSLAATATVAVPQPQQVASKNPCGISRPMRSPTPVHSPSPSKPDLSDQCRVASQAGTAPHAVSRGSAPVARCVTTGSFAEFDRQRRDTLCTLSSQCSAPPDLLYTPFAALLLLVTCTLSVRSACAAVRATAVAHMRYGMCLCRHIHVARLAHRWRWRCARIPYCRYTQYLVHPTEGNLPGNDLLLVAHSGSTGLP